MKFKRISRVMALFRVLRKKVEETGVKINKLIKNHNQMTRMIGVLKPLLIKMTPGVLINNHLLKINHHQIPGVKITQAGDYKPGNK